MESMLSKLLNEIYNRAGVGGACLFVLSMFTAVAATTGLIVDGTTVNNERTWQAPPAPGTVLKI